MESVYTILGVSFFVGVLSLLQLVGVLVHFRMKHFPKLAYLVGFLLTTILSFFVLTVFFDPPVRTSAPTCGMPAMAATMLILFFTTIQMGGSFIAQLGVYVINNKRYIVFGFPN